MLVASAANLKVLIDAAEAAWPQESCALLVGHAPSLVHAVIDAVELSPNRADDTLRRFEIDPALRIGLERELRGSRRSVIGVWHSHPNSPAEPSAIDAMNVFEPHLVWLITGMKDGQALESRAWRPRLDGGFQPAPLHLLY